MKNGRILYLIALFLSTKNIYTQVSLGFGFGLDQKISFLNKDLYLNSYAIDKMNGFYQAVISPKKLQASLFYDLVVHIQKFTIRASYNSISEDYLFHHVFSGFVKFDRKYQFNLKELNVNIGASTKVSNSSLLSYDLGYVFLIKPEGILTDDLVFINGDSEIAGYKLVHGISLGLSSRLSIEKNLKTQNLRIGLAIGASIITWKPKYLNGISFFKNGQDIFYTLKDNEKINILKDKCYLSDLNSKMGCSTSLTYNFSQIYIQAFLKYNIILSKKRP